MWSIKQRFKYRTLFQCGGFDRVGVVGGGVGRGLSPGGAACASGDHWIQAVHNGARDQNGGAALLGGFVDDVHCPQLQRGRVVGIDIGRLDELVGDFGFGGPQDDAGLLFSFGLRLTRHRVLPHHWYGDVAAFH